MSDNRTLRWVTTEAVATELFGMSWASMVHDVSDALFVDYVVVDALEEGDVYIATSSPRIERQEAISEIDLSVLPSDVPLYPGAVVTGVLSETLNEASYEAETSDDMNVVLAWFEQQAPKYGWVMDPPSLLESYLPEGYRSQKFTREYMGSMYALSVVVSQGNTTQLDVVKSLAPEVPEEEPFPALLPVYPNGEVVLRLVDHDTPLAMYSMLTEASVLDVYYWFQGPINRDSWRLVEAQQDGMVILHRYERMVGSTLVNLVLLISRDAPEDLTTVVAMYAIPSLFE